VSFTVASPCVSHGQPNPEATVNAITLILATFRKRLQASGLA